MSITIDGREIGPGQPPYMIAEISANHCGDLRTACEHVTKAKDCGADAVKIQCYTAESICAKGRFEIKSGSWSGWELFDLYKKAETPPHMAAEIINFAKTQNITCFSSVFDFETVDFLRLLGVPAIKIASFEVTDTPLISYASSTELPLILSLGTASRLETIEAVAAVWRGRKNKAAKNLALLHCVSNYPAKAEEANLSKLGPLADLFGGRDHVVGFSDHTMGCGTAAAAVSFGASIIEKHFILDRKRLRSSPDAAFSLEPDEFAVLTGACADAWRATRDHQNQKDCPDQASSVFRKSLWTTAALRQGESFSKANVGILRPANGLAPSLYGSVLAGSATRDLQPYTPLSTEMVSTLS